MATKAGICNMALSHLGVGKEIANLETEKSAEAQACRRFYDEVLSVTLRDFPWPFATKIAALALIEANPNSLWAFSYRYPTDAVYIRRILSGIVPETEASRVSFQLARDSAGKILYTSWEDAEIEYTTLVTETEQYPSDFTMAFSLRLASYLAPRVTAGDPYKLGDRAERKYMMEISQSRATSHNEEAPNRVPESEFITGRE